MVNYRICASKRLGDFILVLDFFKPVDEGDYLKRVCSSEELTIVPLTRLGSARLGSARLGSARLGSARLGSANALSLIAFIKSILSHLSKKS